MNPTRLTDEEVLAVVGDWPGELPEWALALRRVVLKAAPAASEKIAFNSLVYYRAGAEYGVIGGNVCGIGVHKGALKLGFIHGAFLPDPHGLLQGKAKAKRHVDISKKSDIHREALRALIKAAAHYEPSE